MDIVIRKTNKKDLKPLNSQNHITNSPAGELAALGWNPEFENTLAPELVKTNKIARVTGVRKNLFLVNNGHVETFASTLGKLHHKTHENALFPATGDWVILKDGRIASVLPRKMPCPGVPPDNRAKRTAPPYGPR